MCACVVCACGVVGVDEAKAFAVFRPCWLEGLSKVCLCFGFDGLFCCLACCWVSGATQGCCSMRSPLVGKIPSCWLVGVVCWGGVLCENCIVDANAIKITTINSVCVVVCFFFFVVLFLVFFVVCA